MFTNAGELRADAASASAGSRESAIAAIVFVALLLGSITWPAPVVLINQTLVHRPIAVNEVSFLGREAPSWDVAYWWLVGMAVLALLHGRTGRVASAWPELVDDLESMRGRVAARVRRRALPAALLLVVGAALVVASYYLLDARAIAIATGWRSDWLRDCIRLTNRFGGGANPPMVVLFFTLAGLALGRRDWRRLGCAMALAGLVAGAISSLIKGLAQRARPDAWLGHAVFGWRGETSFPSGHTIGAFALMIVILEGTTSRSLRIAAVLLAFSVGLARVLALRHWPSDVLMSAVLGSVVGLVVSGAMRRAPDDEPSRT